MRWVFKKNSENQNVIEIGYSYGTDDSCDGVITYDKSKEELKLKRLSESASELKSERAFQYIYGLLDDNELTYKKYIVCTG